MRVVFLIVDGMPNHLVGEVLTPHIWAMGEEGGRAPDGGVAVMPSSTYPNIATFVTGVGPEQHGIVANWVPTGAGPRPAEEVGPASPTLFDLSESAAREVAVVVGDHHLIGAMGASKIETHWPPGGEIPDGTLRDENGYVADTEVLSRLELAARSHADFIFGHFNGADTAGHRYGPGSERAAATYRAEDECIGQLVSTLRNSRWSETVLFVVSDHGQVEVPRGPHVDIWKHSRNTGVDAVIIPEGDAAVIDDGGGDGRWLDDLEGLEGHRSFTGNLRIAWTEPGRYFGPVWMPGIHGGEGSRAQVAVVAGGHPAVKEIARSIRSRRPRAEDWAPTIAQLLELDLPETTGRSLFD